MIKKITNPLHELDLESSPFYYKLMDSNPSHDKIVVMIKSDFHQTETMSTTMFTKPISKIILIK